MSPFSHAKALPCRMPRKQFRNSCRVRTASPPMGRLRATKPAKTPLFYSGDNSQFLAKSCNVVIGSNHSSASELKPCSPKAILAESQLFVSGHGNQAFKVRQGAAPEQEVNSWRDTSLWPSRTKHYSGLWKTSTGRKLCQRRLHLLLQGCCRVLEVSDHRFSGATIYIACTQHSHGCTRELGDNVGKIASDTCNVGHWKKREVWNVNFPEIVHPIPGRQFANREIAEHWCREGCRVQVHYA